MSQITNRLTQVGTSVGLATIFLASGAAPQIPSFGIENLQPTSKVIRLTYSNATPATFWLGDSKRSSGRKFFKTFRFLKKGRSKPVINHESYFTYWG